MAKFGILLENRYKPLKIIKNKKDIRRFKMLKIIKENNKWTKIEEIWIQTKARNEVLYTKMYTKETATWENLLCGLWPLRSYIKSVKT